MSRSPGVSIMLLTGLPSVNETTSSATGTTLSV
jgi:hypothetical protein